MIIFLVVSCRADSFTTKDEKYTYVVQLCGDADGVNGAGVIQKEIGKKSESGKEPMTIVGRYNSTEAIGGSEY